jgi:two-component system, NtrC family, sensor kinase
VTPNQHHKTSPTNSPGKPYQRVSPENIKILIIDDDIIFRMSLKAMAKDLGEVVEAESGEAGLAYLQQHTVDLILLDLVMPNMSGFDVLHTISKQSNTAGTPVLVLSAAEDDLDIAKAFDMGAVDYLRKPVRKFELIARLTTQLELRNRQLYLEQMVNARTIELIEANSLLQSAQEQLMQADKMAAIGQLAAGVAHEINNPVGFVYSNVSTLMHYLADLFKIIDAYAENEGTMDEPQKARLQSIKDSIDLTYLRNDIDALLKETADGLLRIRKIVQDMKEFSHIGDTKWEMVDIHDGIESTLNIVQNEIKYKAIVEKKYSTTGLTQCISSQINQVLMNILVNAAHAIDADGVITIKTWQENNNTIISISDTGCGMPPEVINKIFNPFFTTKPVGKGTGLGLSLSYNIIQKHHGHIDVQSQPGKGTTFVITLPQQQPVSE